MTLFVGVTEVKGQREQSSQHCLTMAAFKSAGIEQKILKMNINKKHKVAARMAQSGVGISVNTNKQTHTLVDGLNSYGSKVR